MAELSALFWDVGGVLLSNGWDRHARRRAAGAFDLDVQELEDRHALVVNEFETGRISLDEYLTSTVFHRERGFTRREFTQFMVAQSEAFPETLAIVEGLAASGAYLLATLNDESLELNRYRIERFGLKQHFDLFLSSCFVGVTKPDEAIFRMALHLTQREPESCLFIDDRELNVESAGTLGLRTIHYQNAGQLRRELAALGVAIEKGK